MRTDTSSLKMTVYIGDLFCLRELARRARRSESDVVSLIIRHEADRLGLKPPADWPPPRGRGRPRGNASRKA
jgi:hypothetical protein